MSIVETGLRGMRGVSKESAAGLQNAGVKIAAPKSYAGVFPSSTIREKSAYLENRAKAAARNW